MESLSKFSSTFVVNQLKQVGKQFREEFKQAPIVATPKEMKKLFNQIESKCLSALQTSLDAEYPGIPWVDDELNMQAQKDMPPHPHFWLCDTMDGAVQYMHHLAGWTVNLVLFKDGKPFFSAIYDIQQDELFRAEAGCGAFLNDQPFSILSSHPVKQDFPFMLATYNHPPLSNDLPLLNQRISNLVLFLLNTFGAVRSYGPTGLQIALVGAGRIDVFCEEGLDTYNWIGGILIAREAGAKVTDINGKEWVWGDESLLVAAPEISEKFLNKLHGK